MRFWRVLFIVVLCMLLPARGVMAAGMGCGGLQGQGQGPSVMHAGDHDAGHEHATGDAHAAGSGHHGGDAGESSDGSDGSDGCAACAACCHAAALMDANAAAASESPTSQGFPLLKVPQPEYVSAGPERPPRTT